MLLSSVLFALFATFMNVDMVKSQCFKSKCMTRRREDGCGKIANIIGVNDENCCEIDGVIGFSIARKPLGSDRNNGSNCYSCELCEDVEIAKWSDWSDWTECSVTCGIGEQKKTRFCVSPNNKKKCKGSDLETKTCELRVCPTTTVQPTVTDDEDSSIEYSGSGSGSGDKSGWSEWGNWQCRSSIAYRSRKCIKSENPDFKCRGLSYEMIRKEKDSSYFCDVCPHFFCSSESSTEVTTPRIGSSKMPADIISTDVATINGGWSEWGEWTCGKNRAHRVRLCNNPKPSEEGRDCPGISFESRDKTNAQEYCNVCRFACVCDGDWALLEEEKPIDNFSFELQESTTSTVSQVTEQTKSEKWGPWKCTTTNAYRLYNCRNTEENCPKIKKQFVYKNNPRYCKLCREMC